MALTQGVGAHLGTGVSLLHGSGLLALVLWLFSCLAVRVLGWCKLSRYGASDSSWGSPTFMLTPTQMDR